MLSAFDTVARVPGLGQFTCCQREHNIDGREIPCDKIVIGRVMWQMLDVKISKLRAAAAEDLAMIHAFRMWQAFIPHFMTGLTCDLMPPQPTTVAEFLKEYAGHPPHHLPTHSHTAHCSPLPGTHSPSDTPLHSPLHSGFASRVRWTKSMCLAKGARREIADSRHFFARLCPATIMWLNPYFEIMVQP
jgi:hypothetical protein